MLSEPWTLLNQPELLTNTLELSLERLLAACLKQIPLFATTDFINEKFRELDCLLQRPNWC